MIEITNVVVCCLGIPETYFSASHDNRPLQSHNHLGRRHASSQPIQAQLYGVQALPNNLGGWKWLDLAGLQGTGQEILEYRLAHFWEFLEDIGSPDYNGISKARPGQLASSRMAD